jgi:serine protease Do
VEKDSPADKAGLVAGDVVLKFNGKDIIRSNELPPQVAALAPGDRATLEVWREGKTREVTVKVGELNSAEEGAEVKPSKENWLGLEVRPLTPEEKSQISVTEGLLVQGVSEASARAGIRPGDVILSVNGDKVNSAEEFRKAVAKRDKRVALLIYREGMRMFVAVSRE